MNLIELPPRKDQQSLNGYVRDNIERLEQEVASGVPYAALVKAALAAGFSKVAVLSLHSAMYRARKKRPPRTRVLTQQFASKAWPSRAAGQEESAGQLEEDSVLLARRLRQLVRSPRPATDEQDLLI
jgi:hypothetical protein